MAVSILEGVVEKGQIRLRNNVTLPENTKVYIVIPGFEDVSRAHIYSPRLVQPEKAVDFAKEIVEVSADEKL